MKNIWKENTGAGTGRCTMEETKVILAKNVKECREGKGLNVEEAAKRIATSKKYYEEEVEKIGSGLDCISRIKEISKGWDVPEYRLLKGVIDIEKWPDISMEDIISYIKEQPREVLKEILHHVIESL